MLLKALYLTATVTVFLVGDANAKGLRRSVETNIDYFDLDKINVNDIKDLNYDPVNELESPLLGEDDQGTVGISVETPQGPLPELPQIPLIKALPRPSPETPPETLPISLSESPPKTPPAPPQKSVLSIYQELQGPTNLLAERQRSNQKTKDPVPVNTNPVENRMSFAQNDVPLSLTMGDDSENSESNESSGLAISSTEKLGRNNDEKALTLRKALRSCSKKAYKKCYKACKAAYKITCSEYFCPKRRKRSFKRSCKTNCRRNFS